ncbi:MAG: conjugal transfer protein TraG N-terminal domain-containing protein [Proteobacteria bacterium]|nr:conjugal transfer protein TraG N-terminal domain-containing protein [Pseudomonadota bacterium]
MEHVITTYGGGELFALVFNGIAALFKEDRTGMILSLIRVGLMVGSVYIVILILFHQQLIEGLKWFLWVVIATNLIFLPKTTLFIHDPLSNTKHKIDNVPYALGAFASFVSQVGRSITEEFESVFTLPDYMPYHKTGTVFASALMSQVGQFRIIDPMFKGNMERFVNQCIVYDAMIGHKYTLTDLQNVPDIWEFVSSRASPVLGFLYKEDTNPGVVVTCQQGAKLLSTLWNGEIKRATALYGSHVQNRKLTESAFLTDLMGSARLLSEGRAIAENAQNLLRQEMMIHAIEEGSNNKLSELGSPSNYAATKALLQQRSTYAAAGEIAARTLPLFKNVIEALSYALFIFIVVLALLPNGSRILITYFGILVWTQLWAPLYAVLNLIMTLYGIRETMSHGFETGLTLLNSSAIINANTDMTTLAAWLSVSIPFISYSILKQGAGAFVGLAQHLGSAMQSASSGAAAETVSGNVSLGNLSMGTQAYQNTSAFQHQTSPSYNASQFTAMGVDGVETITHGRGAQTFVDRGISQGSVQEMATFNESIERQQRLNHAESIANTKSIAAGKQIDAAYQQTTNLLHHVGSDVSAGENYNKSLTTSESKALQEHKNFIDDIKSSGHFTEAQAMEAAFYAKAGIEVLGTGGGMSGNFSTNAARQKAVETAKSIAQTRGYTESVDKVLLATKAISESKNDTKGSSLASGAMTSLNEARHMRSEAIIAQTKVDEISNSLSSSQSTGIQEQRNITQEILNYIAAQPAHSGPAGNAGGKIGARGALTIQQKRGEEYLAYKRSFQEENPQYALAGFDAPQEQKKLDTQFENASAMQNSESDIREHYDQKTQRVHKEGSEINLDLSAPRPTASMKASHAMEGQKEQHRDLQKIQDGSISEPVRNNHSPSYTNLKTEIEKKIAKTDQEMRKGQENLNSQEAPLQNAVEVSKNQSLLGTTAENLGATLNETVMSMGGKAKHVLENIDSAHAAPFDKIVP